ncbi:DUF4124 domain-containing protein [Colwellia sp. UCD-KL20]|uniref:DUF4124 domain-containing protein n=1 Tax=Colwellia sp. UCD-KL20 TaxID=1917165 RepID=UPI0009711B5A|nr:DUF4124 domain-containing protein [Colwellia sp. UCD-KL20]
MKYLPTALLLAFNLNVIADDVIIYRWVDENNIAHFSQNQPATGDYTEIVMANSNIPNIKNNTPSSPSNADAFEERKKEDKTPKDKLLDMSKQCEEAKANLATLTDFSRVRFVDANGETQILDEEKQAEQITINKKRIEVYCTNSSNKK